MNRDLTPLCERFITRLTLTGALHPVPAALALVARGHADADPATFAATIGLSVRDLLAIESGEVPFADVPDELVRQLGDPSVVCLLRLAYLDARLAPALV